MGTGNAWKAHRLSPQAAGHDAGAAGAARRRERTGGEQTGDTTSPAPTSPFCRSLPPSSASAWIEPLGLHTTEGGAHTRGRGHQAGGEGTHSRLHHRQRRTQRVCRSRHVRPAPSVRLFLVNALAGENSMYPSGRSSAHPPCCWAALSMLTHRFSCFSMSGLMSRRRRSAADRIRLSVHRLPLERPDPGLFAAVGREPAGRSFLRPQAEAAPCASAS